MLIISIIEGDIDSDIHIAGGFQDLFNQWMRIVMKKLKYESVDDVNEVVNGAPYGLCTILAIE